MNQSTAINAALSEMLSAVKAARAADPVDASLARLREALDKSRAAVSRSRETPAHARRRIEQFGQARGGFGDPRVKAPSVPRMYGPREAPWPDQNDHVGLYDRQPRSAWEREVLDNRLDTLRMRQQAFPRAWPENPLATASYGLPRTGGFGAYLWQNPAFRGPQLHADDMARGFLIARQEGETKATSPYARSLRAFAPIRTLRGSVGLPRPAADPYGVYGVRRRMTVPRIPGAGRLRSY